MISLVIKIPHLKIASLVGNLEVGNLEGNLLKRILSLFPFYRPKRKKLFFTDFLVRLQK